MSSICSLIIEQSNKYVIPHKIVNINDQSSFHLSMKFNTCGLSTHDSTFTDEKLTTNTEKEKKEIKFYNIFHRLTAFVVVEMLALAVFVPCWTSIRLACPNTKPFLISEFSYPSDFLTTKTRLSRRVSFGKTKVFLSVV